MIDDLPPGWVLSTLGDIADVQLGRQRPRQHQTLKAHQIPRSQGLRYSN